MRLHPILPLALLTFACLFAGCGASSKERPEGVEPEADAGELGVPAPDPVEVLANETDELFFRGETNAVIERFTAALDEEEFAAHRPRVFNALMRFLLSTANVDEAKARMTAAYDARDFELANEGFGHIFFYLVHQGRSEEADAWLDRTLAVADLPAGMRRQAIDWSMSIRLERGDAEGACDRAMELAVEFPAIAAEQIERACDRLFAEDKLDLADALLSTLINAQPQPAMAGEVALGLKIRLLAARGEWDLARETFLAVCETLPDARLTRLLRHLAQRGTKARQAEFVDALCEKVLDMSASHPQSFPLAARLWVENIAASQPELLPDRLEKLLELDAAPTQVCTLFTRTFYRTTRLPDTLVRMLDLGTRLDALNDDEDLRTLLRTSVLDGSFLLGKYDTAIEMLERGIPGRDAAWNRMALCKVRAHKALYDEEWLDAVKYFREFMATVATAKDEDMTDPESDIRHTKNMVLGFNAKRIGDIFRKIPDEAAARESYAQAREYYAKAREECAGNPEALEIIEEEEATIP
ncbi:MAG: hypothetical protein ACOX5G_08205 [Kiritimatiellia bacterium]|jgi:tetratricopeptide (TPR) repeat protein